MPLTVLWDDDVLDYRAPDGSYYLESSDLLAVDEPHPESPERILNIAHIVERCLAEETTWRSPERAGDDQLSTVHDPAYVEFLERRADDPGFVTPSTWLDAETLDAARLAAGAAIRAGELALEDVTYSLARPPGHHAQPALPDGYCYFNNVALAAEHAIRAGHVDRVAIVDWDVHHGNGTQECFYGRDDVLLVSVHNDHGPWHERFHPQTGSPGESGCGDGEGYTVNVPVPEGTGDAGYAAVFDRIIEPVVAEFDPGLVLVSAGQDPGIHDPQGRNLVTKDGFAELGRRVRALADAHADGALAFVHEGGYQQSHVAFATLGVLEGALGVETGVEDPFAGWNERVDHIHTALDRVVSRHAEHWPVE